MTSQALGDDMHCGSLMSPSLFNAEDQETCSAPALQPIKMESKQALRIGRKTKGPFMVGICSRPSLKVDLFSSLWFQTLRFRADWVPHQLALLCSLPPALATIVLAYRSLCLLSVCEGAGLGWEPGERAGVTMRSRVRLDEVCLPEKPQERGVRSRVAPLKTED